MCVCVSDQWSSRSTHLPGLDLMYTKCTISLYFDVNLYTDIYVK